MFKNNKLLMLLAALTILDLTGFENQSGFVHAAPIPKTAGQWSATGS